MNYPIIMNDVLPVSEFFRLRDEFEYKGWSLDNYAYRSKKMNVAKDRVNWQLNGGCTELIFFKCASTIKLKLQKHLKQNLTFIRAHSNGSTFGQGGKFHIDFDEDDVWTFVLFTEDTWDTQWGGEFVVRDPKSLEYKYVPYIPNSGALIHSNWQHQGSSPNAFTEALRTTIAFSFCANKSLNSVLKNSKIARKFVNG
tara:strand:- start:4418 stop:5008 length:591 start_codon:yes stop_codon:yes gene_type:complete